MNDRHHGKAFYGRGAGGRHQLWGACSRALCACLLLAAILYCASFFVHSTSPAKIPPFAYSQGYFDQAPGIGLARIVPLAGSHLISPATNVWSGRPENSGIYEERQPAQNPPTY